MLARNAFERRGLLLAVFADNWIRKTTGKCEYVESKVSLFVCKQEIIFVWTSIYPAWRPRVRKKARNIGENETLTVSSLCSLKYWLNKIRPQEIHLNAYKNQRSFLYLQVISWGLWDYYASTSSTRLIKTTYPPWHKRCCQHLLLW